MVYGPSFIEIENKESKKQYFNGTIIGGGGVYIQANSGGWQAFRFDQTCLDELATAGNKGKVLTRTGFSILQ